MSPVEYYAKFLSPGKNFRIGNAWLTAWMQGSDLCQNFVRAVTSSHVPK
jgi:hypothetical protein